MHAHCVHDRPLGIFPIEVYEQIIDAVHWHSNDAGGDRIRVMRGVLCTCALTCQAWLPRSRVLLYRSITLYSSPGRTCDRRVVRRLANTIHASSFIADLEIDDLHGFGYSAHQKAQEKLGTTSLGELVGMSKAVLCDALGKGMGEVLYNAMRGVDTRKLESDKPRKSVSCDINVSIPS